jgi:hypothetical protein
MIALPWLRSFSSPSYSLTTSRQIGLPDPLIPLLDCANGNDKAFVTEASLEPLDFAALFNFEHEALKDIS